MSSKTLKEHEVMLVNDLKATALRKRADKIESKRLVREGVAGQGSWEDRIQLERMSGSARSNGGS